MKFKVEILFKETTFFPNLSSGLKSNRIYVSEKAQTTKVNDSIIKK